MHGKLQSGIVPDKERKQFVSLHRGRQRNGDLPHSVGQECVNSTFQGNMELK